MRRYWKPILGTILVVVIGLGVVGYLWLTNLVDPMPQAAAAVEPDEAVAVETEPWLTFSPLEPASTGFIFYPGGRVPPEAYAPPVRAVAEAGYLSVVPSMPFGLAVLSPEQLEFVEVFIRCEGKIKRVEQELQVLKAAQQGQHYQQ